MCKENHAKAHAELNQICFRVDLVPMHTEGPICLVQFLELLSIIQYSLPYVVRHSSSGTIRQSDLNTTMFLFCSNNNS